ncbi:MAG TPA: hypothetical protein EYP04_04680 [Anaerolineae bacterium]|nr:hypothetical protein [Anaerolineae bacterium]HIQ05408.1 hypothetical protein [Anaerolineae bacterium]
MRILTYNIHHWEGIDGRIDVARVAEVVRASGADIVGLNEVFHPAEVPGLDQPALAAMAAMLGMEFAFARTWDYEFAYRGPVTAYGNACLSRYPIVAYAGHRLPPVEGREDRGLLEVRVQLPDSQLFTVYITHLDHRSEEVRLHQLSGLLQWVARDRARPHVLMGDFNALAPGDFAPDDPRLSAMRKLEEAAHLLPMQVVPRVLRSGYVDACAVGEEAPLETWSVDNPRVRIDYIFIPKELVGWIVTCRRWDEGKAVVASDHFPVLVRLQPTGR